MLAKSCSLELYEIQNKSDLCIDEYTRGKAGVVGYWLWCDYSLFLFYDNGDDVFRVVITRLPVNIRTLGALLAIVDGCP